MLRCWEAVYTTYVDAINPQHEKNRIEVYPVPARDRLYVMFQSSDKTPITMTLLTLTGQIVYHCSEKGILNGSTTAINISGLKPGSYILKIKTRDDTKCKKVLIY